MVKDILDFIKPAFVDYLNDVMENEINFISLKETDQDGSIRAAFNEITIYKYKFDDFAKVLVETVKDKFYIYDLKIEENGGFIRCLYAIKKNVKNYAKNYLRKLEEILNEYKNNITILPSSTFPAEYKLFSQTIEYCIAKERKEDYLRMLERARIAKECYQKSLLKLTDDEKLKLELEGE